MFSNNGKLFIVKVIHLSSTDSGCFDHTMQVRWDGSSRLEEHSYAVNIFGFYTNVQNVANL